MPPLTLTYTHRFASDRAITLTLQRRTRAKPVVASSIQCRDLTAEELAEYKPWRTMVVASMMSELSPEEVFACAKLTK